MRKPNTPGSRVPSPRRIPAIGGKNELLPVAMISVSYGVVLPSSASTTLAYGSIRVTWTPAFKVMSLSSYQSMGLRKMSASSSAPASTLDSEMRL